MKEYYIIKELRNEKYVYFYPGLKYKINEEEERIYENTELCIDIDMALFFMSYEEALNAIFAIYKSDKEGYDRQLFQIIKIHTHSIFN